MKYWIVCIFITLALVVFFASFPKKQPCLSPRVHGFGVTPCDPVTFSSYSYFDYGMLYLDLPGRLTSERALSPNN